MCKRRCEHPVCKSGLLRRCPTRWAAVVGIGVATVPLPQRPPRVPPQTPLAALLRLPPLEKGGSCPAPGASGSPVLLSVIWGPEELPRGVWLHQPCNQTKGSRAREQLAAIVPSLIPLINHQCPSLTSTAQGRTTDRAGATSLAIALGTQGILTAAKAPPDACRAPVGPAPWGSAILCASFLGTLPLKPALHQSRAASPSLTTVSGHV